MEWETCGSYSIPPNGRRAVPFSERIQLAAWIPCRSYLDSEVLTQRLFRLLYGAIAHGHHEENPLISLSGPSWSGRRTRLLDTSGRG